MKPPVAINDPPEWFLRELHGVAPDAAVRWCERQQRWQIMRPRSDKEPPSFLCQVDITERPWWRYVCIFRVENRDGSYRPLDMRIIHTLRKSDFEKRDWRDVVQEMDRADAQAEKDWERPLAARRREMAEYFADMEFGRVSTGYGGTSVQAARSRTKEG